MGLHIIDRTKMKLGESKDFHKLPFEEIKKELENYEKKGMKMQIVIEFYPATGYWVVFTQEIFPFGIGGEIQQYYDGAALLQSVKLY